MLIKVNINFNILYNTAHLLDPGGSLNLLSILNTLANGPQTIPALVARIYVGLNPSLTRAAGLSTLAHLEDLSERGMVVGEAPSGGEQHFRLA